MEQRTTRGRVVLNINGQRLVYGRIRSENVELGEENIEENIHNLSIEGMFMKNNFNL